MKQYAYDVFLNGEKIDTVFFNPLSNGNPLMSDVVKKSLIEHDNYDVNIMVFRQGLNK